METDKSELQDAVTEKFLSGIDCVATRVVVVEELRNCGVISKKRAKKRIKQIINATPPVPDTLG